MQHRWPDRARLTIPVATCLTLALSLGCGLDEFPHPDAGTIGGPGTGGGPATGGGGGVSSPGAGGTSGGATGTGGRGGGSGTGGRGGSGTGGAGGNRDAGRDGTTPPDAPSTPPPAGGEGVTINGMQLPKNKVVVFLHIGHSNMAGRTTTPESLRPFNFETHPRLWSYARGGVWRPAREPLSADSMTGSCGGVGCAGLPNGAGPGMSILRTALASAPEDTYFVSIGRGQSGTTGGYCRNFRKGGLLYDYVMVPAMELKGKVTFGAIWTMFSISEVNDRSNISRFGDCMVGVANDMRTDLGEPDLPFVYQEWEAGAGGGVGPSSSTAMILAPQIQMLPMRIPRSVLIPTEGLPINPLDDHHFDLTGHKLWAERGHALLKMNGLSPWATP